MMRTLVRRLILLFAIFVPPSIDAQTVGEYLKAPAPQQNAMVHVLTSRASAAFTVPPRPDLLEDQLSAYEYKRVFGNFIVLMFDTTGVNKQKEPLGFEHVRRTIKGDALLKEAPANPADDLTSIVGGYLESEFKSVDEKNAITNTLPSLAKMTNAVQVAFLKQLYERQGQEQIAAFNKQYEENQKQYEENQKQYEKSQKMYKALDATGSAWKEIVSADQVRLQLEELAINRPYPNEKQIRAHWNEVYLPIVRRLRATKQQNAKTEAESKAVKATFEDYDPKQIAELIQQKIIVNAAADPYQTLYSIFDLIYKQNLKSPR